MRKSRIVLYALALFGLLGSGPLWAALKFGETVELRLRHEYWRNNFDMRNAMTDDRNFFRVKTSLGGRASWDDKAALVLKFTNEEKYFLYRYDSTGLKERDHYVAHEIVFDNLYLDVNHILGFPLDVRAGRQDLSMSDYGEGFLIADGTPADGSRTYYFNAVKATVHAGKKNDVDLLYIRSEKFDKFLPVLNEDDSAKQQINYGDERGWGIYHRGTLSENLRWENFYLGKEEDKGRSRPLIERSVIHTFGSYSKYHIAPWTVRGQFTAQTGVYGDNGRQGYGGTTSVDRDFKGVTWSPKVSAGFHYLSGDDPGTSQYEGWDQIFSPYTWTSELYTNYYMSEMGATQWTNLQMWRASVALQPVPKTTVTLCYSYLRANENVAPSAIFSGTGKERGHLIQTKAEFVFSKNISTYFLAEQFIPGNFYANGADPALFLRTQLQFKF